MVLEQFKINDLCKTLLFFKNNFSHLTSQMLVYDSVIYQYTIYISTLMMKRKGKCPKFKMCHTIDTQINTIPLS